MVNYSLALMSTKPGDETAPKKYYAKAQASGEVTMDEMAEDISYATSLTDGDVLNAIRALIKQVNRHLSAGKIVRLENFGSFQLQLCSTGAETEKKFTSANITEATVQFRPGKPVKAATVRATAGLPSSAWPRRAKHPCPMTTTPEEETPGEATTATRGRTRWAKEPPRSSSQTTP